MTYGIWYTLGVAILGVTIGFFVALSRSPVVGLVLPLLFTLIAGTSGMYLVREDLTQKNGRMRLQFIGICLMAFSIGTLASCMFFLEWKKPAFSPSLTDIRVHPSLASDDLIELLALREVSRILGSTDVERKIIIERAVTEAAGRRMTEDGGYTVQGRKAAEQRLKVLSDIIREFSNRGHNNESYLAVGGGGGGA